MDPIRTKRVPWRSWSDFTGWAQDFSLRQKVLGGFLGVVVLVGLIASLIGTRLARETIINTARVRLHSQLASASYVLRSAQQNVDMKIRLMANSERFAAAVERGDVQEAQNRLAILAVENDLDFLSLTDDKGRTEAKAFVQEVKTNNEAASDAVIIAALKGTSASGVRLVPLQRLVHENPSLSQRLGTVDNKMGMVFESAYPLKLNDKIVGSVYGGIVLNNSGVTDRISQLLFKGEKHAGKDLGSITIYLGNEAISTTLKGPNGLPLFGSPPDSKIFEMVLNKGLKETTWVTQVGTTYLAAAEPISDPEGKIIGAVQVAIQEEPITMIIDRLMATFLIIGLLGVIFMGAITYFLVTWINWPLEQMLHAARRAADGDLSHEVPVIARDEVGELAATFNLMIRNLAESRNKLEAWGKELASKVAAQTGELAQAREQVARIKKLASLEKMADGVAHLMAHIADPMLGLPPATEDESATSRILVLDSDEKVLEVCQRILENEGLEVKSTRSVKEALDELESRLFDVVVAAVDMPEMSGTELFKEIKYRQPEVLVIFTAPFKDSEEAVETVKLGAFDYIPKPFGPHQILLMIYTALQARQMLRRTRHEHAQRRAETIFQRVPVAIALADEAHRVVYNNKAFLELASVQGEEGVQGKTFNEIFGVDPLEVGEEKGGSKWLELHKVGRTAKLYTFLLPEEDLAVLMLLDVTDTVKKDQQADVLRTETLTRAQQVIHQQMRVAQEIAGLLGETTAETKAALFELIKLAGQEGETR